MKITKLKLTNFRCFPALSLSTKSQSIIIEGQNGSGKTSIIEALYYACYLRSFRTRSGKELSSFDSKGFGISITIENKEGEEDLISIGFSDNNKIVKINNTVVASFKELLDHCHIVSLCENDLDLIAGLPEVRRYFLDQALFLEEASHSLSLRKYKQLLLQRNSLLLSKVQYNSSELKIWTEQLWEISKIIQKQRINYLDRLQKSMHDLMKDFFHDSNLDLALYYISKSDMLQEGISFTDFWNYYKPKIYDEIKYGRSLFGAHLDDITISFKNKKMKVYASRGQKKLAAFLLKASQLMLLRELGKDACFILDDFLTDLDPTIIKKSIHLLESLNCQFFITAPIHGFFENFKFKKDPLIIKLS